MKPLLFLLALTPTLAFSQGPLDPSAAPAPSMKTLAQIEARTAIPAAETPIDGPHYIINEPGSYYLTGNINVATGDGIQINASNVTLDLAGFALISTTVESPTAGSAILLGPGISNIHIRNGNILGGTTRTAGTFATFTRRGWFCGILDSSTFPGENLHVSHVHVKSCSAGYYLATKGSILTDLSATGNGYDGIFIFQGTVTGCTALQNGSSGITVLQGNIAHSTATENNTTGITSTRGDITHCTANANGSSGISLEKGTASYMTATGNGSTGIFAPGSSVSHSRATSNYFNGIFVGIGVAAHCVASENDTSGGAVDRQIQVSAGGQRDACVPAAE